jgi:NAD(P)H-dependent flavin oxidoreductase YrpB (nitropropane dioxygenase family)
VGEDTLIAPIVSGARALKLLCRRWKTYNRLPDLVILEGAWAGGHLGFSDEDIKNYKEEKLIQETRDVRAFLDTLKEQKDIPLFLAGNAFDEHRIKKLLDAGADGFQFGTPFIATEECDVSDVFKKVILDAKKEDIVLIKSPVGMPARAIRTPFISTLRGEKQKIRDCRNCLRPCTPAATEFCISKVLIHAAKGNYEEGLFFAGDGVDKINKIRTVKEVLDEACLYILRAGSPGCGHGEGSL